MASDSGSSTSEERPIDAENEDGWEDLEPDVESQTFKSLFEDKWFSGITEMLQHDKQRHGFDFIGCKNQLNLDYMGMIQLVNFVRSQVKEGKSLPEDLTSSLIAEERYLRPAMEDDAVLYSLEDIDETKLGHNGSPDQKDLENQSLRERLDRLEKQFTAYRDEVQKSFQKTAQNPNGTEPTDSDNTSLPPAPAQLLPPTTQQAQDSSYFSSYSSHHIHSTMLKDTVRTAAYRNFIYGNKDLFANKTVLDVGCGTGILSLFCAKAGAKLVIAVDNSAIIDKARAIVYENGLQDRIRCLRGKIEEVALPLEVGKVDIIISEWMGYGLLYESMLDSVLWARDRYLDPANGLLVPSHATLRLAPLIDSELRIEHVDFWSDVYGFNMRSMLESAFDEALVTTLDPDDVPTYADTETDPDTDPDTDVNMDTTADTDEQATGGAIVPILQLNLHTATITDLKFTTPFSFRWPKPPTPSSSSPSSYSLQALDGWALWFDMYFARTRSQTLDTRRPGEVRGVESFSTGPVARPTHWQQVALLAKRQVWAGDAVVKGHLAYRRNLERDRSLEIEVGWEVEGGRDEKGNKDEDGEKSGSGSGSGAGAGEGGSKREQTWILD